MAHTVSPATTGLRPVDTMTLHDRVYAELRRAIMAGVYRPGEGLSMGSLARSIGTSLMPVREALRRLAAERAVQILPKRGVVIPLVGRSKYVEIGRVRTQLEGMATEMAAPLIGEEDLDGLEVLCAYMNECAEDRARWQDYVMSNYEFHFTVYRSGRPEVLLPIIESLWLQSGPLRNLYGEAGVRKRRGQHEEIIAALRSRDPERARGAMEQDIRTGVDFFCEVATFPDDEDRGGSSRRVRAQSARS
jgi:DNA-binding GntR family transcriptional regulator